jgi:hypothetical protein
MFALTRRQLLGAAASAAALATSRLSFAADDALAAALRAEVEKRHDEGVRRLQDWVKQPAIAAENRGMEEGCTLMMQLAKDAGFQKVSRVFSRPSTRAPSAPWGCTSCTT